jgi:hypothetical protein
MALTGPGVRLRLAGHVTGGGHIDVDVLLDWTLCCRWVAEWILLERLFAEKKIYYNKTYQQDENSQCKNYNFNQNKLYKIHK